MDWIREHIISYLVGAIPVGTIAFLVLQQAKRASTFVDDLTPWLKRAAIALIAVVLTALGAAVNVPIICEVDVNCLDSLSQDKIEALIKVALATVTALIIHKKK